MIEVGLEYNSSDLDAVIEAFVSLPLAVRPTYFATDEKDVGGRATLIQNREKFSAFVKRNDAGFFLRGQGLTYSIRLAGGKPIMCDCFFEIAPIRIREFLFGMAQANPVFGFACAPEEREWRNRITVKIGVSTIESWVGRNTNKYLPGLYWMTLISQRLGKMHSIATDELVKRARERWMLDSEQTLLQFYASPEEWLANKDQMDSLYTSNRGIFNIERSAPSWRLLKHIWRSVPSWRTGPDTGHFAQRGR